MGGAIASLVLLGGLGQSAWPLLVSGGELASTCQWPTVAAFRTAENKCTGTLIDPRWVLTAAHCLIDGVPDNIRFGEAYSPYERKVDVAECFSHQRYARSGAPSDDFAVCRLVAPVSLPPTPLLTECERDELVMDDPAVMVGFGITESGEDFGRKRFVSTELAGEPRSDGTIFVGSSDIGGCDGDSGGPAFVQLSDGGWRALGVLVYGPECGAGPSLYKTLTADDPWLVETIGALPQPCLDAAPSCQLLAADPFTPTGDWSDDCTGPLAHATMNCAEAGDTEVGSTGASDSSTATTAATPATPGDQPRGAGCNIASQDTRVAISLLILLGLFRHPLGSSTIGSVHAGRASRKPRSSMRKLG